MSDTGVGHSGARRIVWLSWPPSRWRLRHPRRRRRGSSPTSSPAAQTRVFSGQLPDGIPPALLDVAAQHDAGAQEARRLRDPRAEAAQAALLLEIPHGGGAVPDDGVVPASRGIDETTVTTVTLPPRHAALLLG